MTLKYFDGIKVSHEIEKYKSSAFLVSVLGFLEKKRNEKKRIGKNAIVCVKWPLWTSVGGRHPQAANTNDSFGVTEDG